MGLSKPGSGCLWVMRVGGCSREPVPPARMMPFTSMPPNEGDVPRRGPRGAGVEGAIGEPYRRLLARSGGEAGAVGVVLLVVGAVGARLDGLPPGAIRLVPPHG